MAECEKRGEVLPSETKIICLVTGMNLVHAESAKKTQRTLKNQPFARLAFLFLRPLRENLYIFYVNSYIFTK